MSGRARDVAPVTLASYLLALGAVMLLDSLGIRSIGVAGLVGVAFGLAFVALGVLAILAAWRVRRFTRQMRRAIGHVRSAEDGWAVEDAVVSTVIGDISLDLRQTRLPAGETELTLLCWVGTIQVRVPRDTGIDVTAQSIVGTVDILGRHEAGIVRDVHVRTDSYEQRAQRVKLHLSTFVGELLVIQS